MSNPVAGYLAAALQRPPRGRRDASHMPTPGANCVACKGTRWWSGDKREWSCMSCMPPSASTDTLHITDATP